MLLPNHQPGSSRSEHFSAPSLARTYARRLGVRLRALPPHDLALLAAGAIMGLLSNGVARHWLMVLVANLCILGGILAAPVVSVIAWIGLTLPTHALLHQVAPLLFGASVIWLCLAIVSAHAQSGSPQGPEDH